MNVGSREGSGNPITKEEMDNFKKSVHIGDRVKYSEKVPRDDGTGGLMVVKTEMEINGIYRNFVTLKAGKMQRSLTWPELLISKKPGWKPSIHMPKEAARIWLKVTDVRAERLQDIGIEGCEKEGVWCGNNGDIFAFMKLWDSTIKKPDIDCYGWNANPWVWVIGFGRCEKPEPCILRGVEPAEEKRPCIGYGDAWADEPCEMCKGCSQCTGNDEEAEG